MSRRYLFLVFGLVISACKTSSLNRRHYAANELESKGGAQGEGDDVPPMRTPPAVESTSVKDQTEPATQTTATPSTPQPPSSSAARCTNPLSYPLVMQEISCYKNVGEVMQALPAFFRDEFVLAHKSESSQASASLNEPRIILYSADAHTLLGITSTKSDPRRETLEIAQLDPNSGRWDFKAINFQDSNHTVTGPEVCQTCHGNPARPIWQTYPLWPNFFGSGYDTSDVTRRSSQLTLTQATAMNDIIARKDQDDRFKYVNIPIKTYVELDRLAIPNNYYGYANVVFTNYLSWAQAKSIFLRVKAAPLYKRYQQALLADGFCQGQNPPTVETKAQLDVDFKVRYADQVLADYERIYEVLGINVRNDFQLYRRNIDPVTTYTNFRGPDFLHQESRTTTCESCYFQGGGYIHEFVDTFILNDYLQQNPAQATLLGTSKATLDRLIRYTSTESAANRYAFNKTSYVFSTDVRAVKTFLTANLTAQAGFCSVLNQQAVASLKP